MENPDGQLYARVAWLYHMEDMTQADIAERLGMTRLRVNRILAECRSQGIVRVLLNTSFERCVALERRLVREHGLADAVIMPTPHDQDRIQALLGQVAGRFLLRHVDMHRIRALGIGWGVTLREAIRSMEPRHLEDASVVSMLGGLTQGSDFNTFEIAGELAKRLGAKCFYFAAPIYAGSARSRNTILEQDVFVDVTRRIQSVEAAFLSLGDMTERSLIVRHGLPSGVTAEALVEAGAVGEILGQFLDASGRLIAHEINRRAIGPSIDLLMRIPSVIVAAGGLHKAGIIAAALKGGFTNVLISDEQTVEAALRLL